MGEGLVGLRHLVDVFAALHRCTGAVGRIENLVRETHRHRGLFALAGELHEPTDGKGLTAPGPDLYGNLIGGATDTP